MKKKLLGLVLVLSLLFSLAITAVAYRNYNSKVISNLRTALDKLKHARYNCGHYKRTTHWLGQGRNSIQGARRVFEDEGHYLDGLYDSNDKKARTYYDARRAKRKKSYSYLSLAQTWRIRAGQYVNKKTQCRYRVEKTVEAIKKLMKEL